MTGHSNGLPPEELRALIRDVLHDVLPAAIERAPGRNPGRDRSPGAAALVPAARCSGRCPAGCGRSGGREQPRRPRKPRRPRAHPRGAGARHAGNGRPALTRPVRVETDADLHQFVLEIVRLADNPARRRDLLSGRLTFTLTGRASETPATGEHRIEAGAVTERAVQSAAKAGQRLVLGPRAVLTPLARDRALALGVPIERER